MIADTSSRNAAAEWIRARWASFLALNEEFPRLMHRAAEVRAGSDDPATRAAAAESIIRLRKLWDLYAFVVSRARDVAGLTQGLGAFFAWPAAVIAVALSVAWVWTRYDAEYAVVRAMEAGRITPEEARRLLEELEGGGPSAFFGPLGTVATVGLLVGTVYLFAPYVFGPPRARAR